MKHLFLSESRNKVSGGPPLERTMAGYATPARLGMNSYGASSSSSTEQILKTMLRVLYTPKAQGQLMRPSARILRVRTDRVHAAKLNAKLHMALHIVGFRLRDSERNAGDEGW